jgi:hypothetical protein
VDKKKFDEIQERLLEINKVIEKLDPSIRTSAFELLKGHVTSGTNSHADGGKQPSDPPPDGVDLATLIANHVHDKPSDNVHLLTADFYRRYGSAPFTVDTLREAAVSAGLTVPDRLDMTLKQAKDGGKNLYQSAGHGLYKPTVPGELYLKKTYKVPKGTEPVPVVKP